MLALVVRAASAIAGEDEGYDCGLLAVDGAGGAACAEEAPASGLDRQRPDCRHAVEAVFWAGSDWIRLAGALAAEPAGCVTYSVSIPALANPKTGLRVLQDDAVRNLGIRPLAEVNLDETTGWPAWTRANGKSWFEAGVEFGAAWRRPVPPGGRRDVDRQRARLPGRPRPLRRQAG